MLFEVSQLVAKNGAIASHSVYVFYLIKMYLWAFILSEVKRQSKLQQSANTDSTSARRCSEVDSIVKSSKLSASAPEFVPAGTGLDEVR